MLTTALVNGKKISIAEYVKPRDEHKDQYVARCIEGHTLIAKKGTKVVHHFAHAPGQDCHSRTDNKMTTWHSQWQEIVADKQYLECCIDEHGKILGYSTFNGGTTQAVRHGHIADIIKFSLNMPRPSIVEIQHSSMNSETMAERERFYKDMIWVFDGTARVTTKNGKYNKIAMVDGKLSYLKEKISYVLTLATTNVVPATATSVDEQITTRQLNASLALSGLFVIFNTKTKYWFEAKKPVYFDVGFYMLRLIKSLNNNFHLAMIISYEQFCYERMPPVNVETINKSSWFKTANHEDLIRLQLMPKILKVQEITIVNDSRISIKHAGNELAEMGLNKGIDDWFYVDESSLIAKQPYKPASSSDSFLFNFMNNAGVTISKEEWDRPTYNVNSSPVTSEAIIITKLRSYLKISLNVEIEIISKGKMSKILVYVDKEIIMKKDKLLFIGMKLKKETKKDTMRSHYHGKLVDVDTKLNLALK